MGTNKFIRSVRLRESACQGCINCIKYCPTQQSAYITARRIS